MAGFFFALMTFFVRMSGDLPTMQKAFFRNAVAAVAAVKMCIRDRDTAIETFKKAVCEKYPDISE